jgi:hypothetical protein
MTQNIQIDIIDLVYVPHLDRIFSFSSNRVILSWDINSRSFTQITNSHTNAIIRGLYLKVILENKKNKKKELIKK